ncbi:MAG: RNA polymerase factor sigma-54 [Phycisphaerales bacterium]|nr:RNA polymerase factor sigma-54 [Phycisphaerales bacterium]
MRFETQQNLSAQQNMQLSPRVIQSMEILQLPLPALIERIQQELESNFALELVEPQAEKQDDIEASEEDDFTRLEEFEATTGADLSDRPIAKPREKSGERDAKLDAFASIRAKGKSLLEVISEQWSFAEVEPPVKDCGFLLLTFIDHDGFLTMPIEEMVQELISRGDPPPSVPLIEQTILQLQQWLDPPGLAARSVQESLLLQVDALMKDDPNEWNTVGLLISTYYTEIIENRLPVIAAKTKMTIEEINEAIEKMHDLVLSPGRLLRSETVLPVVPDAFIEYDEASDTFVTGIRDGNMPPLRLCAQYDSLLQGDRIDDSAKKFLQRNVNSARWMIEAIGQRRTTLLRVVEIIADRQRDFLEQGDAYLRPLPMTEVADMLGVHVATISRAVSDKWVQTPRGLFMLRRFFSGGTGSDLDGEMSWEAVKTRLQEIVDAEDKKKPLSDEKLAAALREQGIEIARRTVVKYRQQLGIPAARLRREY